MYFEENNNLNYKQIIQINQLALLLKSLALKN